MTGRDAILARIRASNGRAGPVPAEQARANEARLADHKPNLIPARAQGDKAELVARFVAMAEEVAATVDRVAAPDDVPGAVARYLAGHNLGTDIVASPDARLDAYPWAKQATLTLRRGLATPEDAVSLTPVFCGVAETGSMMVHSGTDTPQSLHFMPPTHIAVVRTKDIVGAYETAWARLRAAMEEQGEPFPPRTVTLITGPSRTSDIEKTSYVGIHGPHRLHIVLVDEPDA